MSPHASPDPGGGGIVVVTAAALSAPGPPLVHAVRRRSLRMAGLQGRRRRPEWHREPVATRTCACAVEARRPVRPARYLPDHVRRAIVLVGGRHALGIDEPRLYGLAHELAAVGNAVLTPELPDLQRYDITPRTTDMIEMPPRWLSAQPGSRATAAWAWSASASPAACRLSPPGRPALRDRAAFVFSFGGHGDFQRVLRFLCSGMERRRPAGHGRRPPPSRTAARTTTASPSSCSEARTRSCRTGQVEPLREAILTFLRASHYDLIDKRKATREFADARAMADALPEPARTLYEAGQRPRRRRPRPDAPAASLTRHRSRRPSPRPVAGAAPARSTSCTAPTTTSCRRSSRCGSAAIPEGAHAHPARC